MRRRPLQNVGASIQARLHKLSQERKEDFHLILTRYGLERLLYRLSVSQHRDEFVLKGAMLFTFWTNAPHRATRDLDLLGFGSADIVRLEEVFRELCNAMVADDGVAFDAKSVRGANIRKDQDYGGVRITMQAKLLAARIPIQIDVGFGDAVTPKPEFITFPVLLKSEAPRIRAYSRESVVAEKLHAITIRGMANSRMKDFYDVRELAQLFSFDGRTLTRAIRATFERRVTELPQEPPLAFTPEFSTDRTKGLQWKAFLRKMAAGKPSLKLVNVIDQIAAFAWPPLEAVGQGNAFAKTWTPRGPWD